MFSTIVKTTSYTTGMVRNLLRAESHIIRSISTSNDVKNSDILTKNKTVEEVAANKDMKKLKKRYEFFFIYLYFCSFTLRYVYTFLLLLVLKSQNNNLLKFIFSWKFLKTGLNERMILFYLFKSYGTYTKRKH